MSMGFIAAYYLGHALQNQMITEINLGQRAVGQKKRIIPPRGKALNTDLMALLGFHARRLAVWVIKGRGRT